jgi:hypothetical protein
MKSKQFLTLTAIAIVILAIGTFVTISRRDAWQSKSTGSAVLPKLKAADVTKFVMKGEHNSVTIEYKDDAWRVAERYGYPAKYEALATFLEDLEDLRVTQSLQVGESQYGRLKVNDLDKDDSGTLLKVYGEGGKELASLVLGKEHEKKGGEGGPMGMGNYPDGRYLRVAGTDQVVLVAKTLSRADDEPGRWLDDEFFKVGDLKEATLSEDGKELWHVSRADKSANLTLAGDVPDGKEVDTSKLNSIKTAFSYARFTDVADPTLSPEETGLDKAKTYVAHEFDGIVYTVAIGKKSDAGKYYVTVAASYEGPSERTPAEDEKAEDKDKLDKAFADKLAEQKKKVADLNGRTKGWVYLVDSWTVENVTKTRDELLKDKPKPKNDEEKDEADTPAPAEVPAE